MALNKYCTIYVRVSQSEFKKFKYLRENGFSAREVLEIVIGKCTEYPIPLISKTTREPVQIPKNILSKKSK